MIKHALFAIVFLAQLSFVSAPQALAAECRESTALQTIYCKLNVVGNDAFNQNDLLQRDARWIFIERIVAVLNVFLSLLVLVMVILILYGGYLWMTARGNESQVDDAKNTIRNAIYGVVIILAAGAITNFVVVGVFEALIGENNSIY